MIKEIHGVKIPNSLQENEERARSYAAGYLFCKVNKKAENMPEDIREIGKEYRNEDIRQNLEVPEITRSESSFWAGYITASSASRDKTRSGSHTYEERDLLQELGRPTRSLRRELSDLFHLNDE